MPMGLGIGLGMQFSGGAPAVDPVLELLPTLYYRADDGYYVDGAIRFGHAPPTDANVNNWLSSTDASLASGVAGLSGSAWFCIDGDNATPSNQTIASKGAAAKFEWELTWDRSTTFVTFKPYALNGATSATATSAVPCATGTWHHVAWYWSALDSKAYISVDNETPVASSGTISIGSSDGAFRIGSWFNATQNLNGRIDSFGLSVGDSYAYAQRVQLYNAGAGKRYQDITGIKTLTAWWDFGNATTHDTADPIVAWDWLKDEVAGLFLTQNTAATYYPYVTKGFIAPVQTDDTDNTCLGYFDATSNARHGIQHFYWARPGFKTVSSKKWFYLDGVRDTGVTNGYNGSAMLWMMDPTTAAAQAGTNKPWSACCKFKLLNKYHSSAEAAPSGEPFAHTLFGTMQLGSFPYLLYTAGTSDESGHAVRFLTRRAASAGASLAPFVVQAPTLADRWFDHRVDTAGLNAQRGDTNYSGRVDTDTHVAVFVFDGTNSKLWIDGELFYSNVQTNENTVGSTAMGSQAIKAFAVGEGCIGADNFGFAGDPFYGGFGRAMYGYIDHIAFWANTALTSDNVATITSALWDGSVPALTGAMAAPTTTTGLTLLRWYDAAYYPGFVGRSGDSALTRVAANDDLVGIWRCRKTTGVTAPFITASSDAKRVTYKTNVQNSLPALRSASTQCLSQALTQAQPFTLFIVGRRESGTAAGYFWGSGSSDRYFGFPNTTTARTYCGTVLNGTSGTQTAFALWEARCDGASSSIVRDGVTIGSGDAGANGIATAMVLFALTDSGSTWFLQADIAEFRLYTGTDAGGETAAIRAELKAKWATP